MQEKHDSNRPLPLRDARILAVEDDFVVLLDVVSVLEEAGAASVRTCSTIEEALSMVDTESFSAAILDVRIGRETVAPVIDRLVELGTPFVFYTGQLKTEPTVARWSQAPMVSKPAPASLLVDAVAGVLKLPSIVSTAPSAVSTDVRAEGR